MDEGREEAAEQTLRGPEGCGCGSERNGQPSEEQRRDRDLNVTWAVEWRTQEVREDVGYVTVTMKAAPPHPEHAQVLLPARAGAGNARRAGQGDAARREEAPACQRGLWTRDGDGVQPPGGARKSILPHNPLELARQQVEPLPSETSRDWRVSIRAQTTSSGGARGAGEGRSEQGPQGGRAGRHGFQGTSQDDYLVAGRPSGP